MSVSLVKLPTDVLFCLMSHSLSTEDEEVGGLLVGQVKYYVADISAVILFKRDDKKKNRVEISVEQLCNASTEAERMSVILKKKVRIIGWYHSHPKVAVWPSDVDKNSQFNYQYMDKTFIGLIVSVFNQDPSKMGGRIMLTCYQSQNVMEGSNFEKKRVDIPLHIVPSNYINIVNMNALIQLPSLLRQEEHIAYQAAQDRNLDFLTTLHNSSVYIKSMGHIAEVISGPLIKVMEEMIINNKMKIKQLLALKKEKMALIEQLKIEVAQLKLAAEASPDITVKVSHNVSLDTGRVSTASADKAVESFITLPRSSQELSTAASLLELSASPGINSPQPSYNLELAAMMDSELLMKDHGNLPVPSNRPLQPSDDPELSHTEPETGKSDVQFPVSSADQVKDID